MTTVDRSVIFRRKDFGAKLANAKSFLRIIPKTADYSGFHTFIAISQTVFVKWLAVFKPDSADNQFVSEFLTFALFFLLLRLLLPLFTIRKAALRCLLAFGVCTVFAFALEAKPIETEPRCFRAEPVIKSDPGQQPGGEMNHRKREGGFKNLQKILHDAFPPMLLWFWGLIAGITISHHCQRRKSRQHQLNRDKKFFNRRSNDEI